MTADNVEYRLVGADEDPLLLLRNCITTSAPSLLTRTSDPRFAGTAKAESLAEATHLCLLTVPTSKLYPSDPELCCLSLDGRTRFVAASPDDVFVNLRSIYFAWQQKMVDDSSYAASVHEPNSELSNQQQICVLSSNERRDLIMWLEGNLQDSTYIKSLEGTYGPAIECVTIDVSRFSSSGEVFPENTLQSKTGISAPDGDGIWNRTAQNTNDIALEHPEAEGACDVSGVLSSEAFTAKMRGIEERRATYYDQEGVEFPKLQNKLCGTCSRAPIKDMLQHPHCLYIIGPIEDIRDRRSGCSLCWLVFECINKNTPHLLEQALSGDIRELNPVYCHLAGSSYGSFTSILSGKGRHWLNRIGVHLWPATAFAKDGEPPFLKEWFCGHLALLSDDAHLIDQPAFNRGRLLHSSRLEVGLLRSWFLDCMDTHNSGYCDNDFAREEGMDLLKGFMVVDAQTHSLVDLPTDASFAALSYCWGNSNQFTTTLATLESLKEPGALFGKSVTMSATVRDTIQLVAQLGFRYLWVDALCIVQDDQDARAKQIEQMHAIYARAGLTIIAASGDNADAGLPGVSETWPRRAQKMALVNGLRLMVTFAPLDELIIKAPWSKRCWTYQERMVSKKLLIIAEEGAHFYCGQQYRCEDTYLEYEGLWNEDEEASNEGIKFSIYPQQQGSLWSRIPFLGRDLFDEYTTDVEGFSARELRFARDRLPAFAGVMVMTSISKKWSFGIPDSFLDAAVSWRRRDLKIDEVEQKQNVTQLLKDKEQTVELRKIMPSWSWLSIMCQVQYEDRASTKWILRAVDWAWLDKQGVVYRSMESHSEVQLGTLRAQRKDLERLLSMLGSTESYSPITLLQDHIPDFTFWDDAQPWPKGWCAEYLLGWTKHVCLVVKNDMVLDRCDNAIGRMWFDVEARAAEARTSETKVNLILLSCSGRSARKDESLGSMWKIYSQALGQEQAGTGSDPQLEAAWTLNVLAVVWEGQYARRIGIGQVHEDGWLGASPEKILMKLK